MIQRTSTVLTRFARALLLTSLAALALTLPNPVSGTRVANAAAAPASVLLWTAGTEIQLQLGYNILTTKLPPMSAFELIVDGTRLEVASIRPFSLFTYLVLSKPIYRGQTAVLTYNPPPVDNTVNNEALQNTSGSDTVYFTATISTAGGAPLPVPSRPGTATVVAGEESATITVTPPTSGNAPTSYTVTASPGGQTCTVTGASGSCTITGLAPGTAYTFTTVATNEFGNSSASAASAPVTALAKTPTAGTNTTVATGSSGSTSTNTASWDVEPATDSEFDTNTEGFFPNPIPGVSIITNEFGFVIDKKGGIKPKIRMKNYSGKIKMTISAKYKVAGKTKNYKCTFKPFGTTKKVKSVKWRWYTPKKACILPKPLIAAVQKGETTISAKGKWTRQWLTSAKKARPDKTKIKARTLKYTMRAKPAVVK